MAKPKGYVKRAREFINTPKSGCMAGVSWRVHLDYEEDWIHTADYLKKHSKKPGKADMKYKASVDANIEMNQEGRSHYVTRKADLRALRTMRKHLDAFEDACLEALNEAEEYNSSQKAGGD